MSILYKEKVPVSIVFICRLVTRINFIGGLEVMSKSQTKPYLWKTLTFVSSQTDPHV